MQRQVTSPLKLECNIYPSILDDTQKLILEPSGSVIGSDDDIPTLDLINGTVNDYIFTPVRSVNATYTYDIMQMGNELKNDVIDTLTIIVAADSINPVIEERGIQQERIDRASYSTLRHPMRSQSNSWTARGSASTESSTR